MRFKIILIDLFGIVWIVALTGLTMQLFKMPHTDIHVRFLDCCLYTIAVFIALVVVLDSPYYVRRVRLIFTLVTAYFIMASMIVPRASINGSVNRPLLLSAGLIVIAFIGMAIFFKAGFLFSDNIIDKKDKNQGN